MIISNDDDDVYVYLQEPLRTTTRYTHRHIPREAGRGGTVRAQPSGAHPESYRGAWWARPIARSAGPFVGMLSAEEDNEDVTGGERHSSLHHSHK